MQVTPPGPKEWNSLLPSMYARNPYVVVVMPSIRAAVLTMKTREGIQVDVCEWDGKKHGLQVVEPELATYPAHQDIFDQLHIPMLPVRWMGKVNDVPNELLCSDDFTPLFLLRDAMWRPYLHVRRYVGRMTKEVNDGLSM